MLQADPEKYYHVFTAGKFPYYNWENGKWDTFEILPEYVEGVAACYDATVHKAPVRIGHPFSEAEALAWVVKVKSDNGKLFNSFDYIDQELIDAIQKKKYQYVSTEFHRVMGIDNDYQVALGITNLPRVSGQTPLNMKDAVYGKGDEGRSIYSPLTSAFSLDLVKDFTASNKKYFFQNQNNNSMNELLKKLALLFSIDVVLHNSDESVAAQISDKFSKMSSDNAALVTEVKALKDERVKFTIDLATEEGKIKPADKDSYESLLQGNFEAARKVLMSLPANPALKVNATDTNASGLEDPAKNAGDKFSNADGSKLTFEQFSEAIQKDPAFAKKFSDEEIASLPDNKFYKK